MSFRTSVIGLPDSAVTIALAYEASSKIQLKDRVGLSDLSLEPKGQRLENAQSHVIEQSRSVEIPPEMSL